MEWVDATGMASKVFWLLWHSDERIGGFCYAKAKSGLATGLGKGRVTERGAHKKWLFSCR